MTRLRTCAAAALLLAAGVEAREPAYTVPVEDMRLAKGATRQAGLGGPYMEVAPNHTKMRVASAQLAGVAPGQYEAVFRAAAPDFSGSTAYVQFITYCKSPQFRRTKRVKGTYAPRDGSPFEAGFTFTAEKTVRLAFEIDVLNNQYKQKKGSTEKPPIDTFKLWRIELYRVDKGILVQRVRSDKVYYKPGERGTLSCEVQNVTAKSIGATVEFAVRHQIAHVGSATSRRVELAPGGKRELSFEFATDDVRFGCEASVEVRAGAELLARGGDFFSVHDEFWAVGLGGTTRITGHSGLTNLTPESIERNIEELRGQYVNWWEKIFWPPDDWGDMTPETENWMSGQSARWESATNIKTFVHALKPHGIKSITYGKHVAMGPAGWEMVRRKPEWFYHNTSYQPKGRFHTEDLYTWNDLAYHSTKDKLDHKTFHGVFWIVSPDLRQERVVMHGINEMIESSKRFGWDGVRFDGHWTAGNDALSTHNMRLLKTHLRDHNPEYLFGFNYSWSYGHHTSHMNNRGMVSMDHEYAESMAGGGMHMQEAIGHFGYAAAQKYSKWSDYAKKEVAACRGVNTEGGHYYFIYRLPKNTVDKLYKFVLGTAAGAHPCYGAQNQAPGAASWPRFMTRWSAILFDKHARTMTSGVDVEAGSGRELWWKEWTRERVADARTRHVIVHLINPPLKDSLKDTSDPLPPAIENVSVRVDVPSGQRLKRVVALDPRAGWDAIELSPRRRGRSASVAAGDVSVWRIVVFEFGGRFTVPRAEPLLTRAPDPAEVEAGRRSSAGPVGVDPMRPEVSSTIKGKVKIVETDKSYNSVGALGTDDGDALNGVAQWRSTNVKSRMIGKSWATSLKPGRYIAHLRIKIEDDGATPATHSVYMRLLFHGVWDRKVRLGSDPAKYKGDQLLKVDGKYHYYPIPIEMPKVGSPSFLGGASVDRPGSSRLYLDHIAFETIELYTDTKLSENDNAKPPAGRPGGAPGLDVFLAKGWTWDTYRLDDAFPEKGGAARVGGVWARGASPVKFPQKHDGLWDYDVVVLANVGAQGLNYEGRRALKDFVEAGGGLVILGGVYTLGNGSFANTFLADMMPVRLHDKDVIRPDSPLALAPVSNTRLIDRTTARRMREDRPSLYWLHELMPAPGATVHVTAGRYPVLVTRAEGKGRVAVFAGTVLGEKRGDETPFWEWDGWRGVLKSTVEWAAGK